MSTTLTPSKASTQPSGSSSSTNHSSSAASTRQAAISAVTTYAVNSSSVAFADTLAQEYYSTNVFNKAVMKERLPKPIFKSLIKTIESGEKLDPAVADFVASAMKD